MQKSNNFIIQHRTPSILDNKIGQLLDIGHHRDCLQWEMDIYFSYLFCLLFYYVYFYLPGHLPGVARKGSTVLRI